MLLGLRNGLRIDELHGHGRFQGMDHCRVRIRQLREHLRGLCTQIPPASHAYKSFTLAYSLLTTSLYTHTCVYTHMETYTHLLYIFAASSPPTAAR